MSSSRRLLLLLYVAIAAAVLAAGVCRIADPDFFWQLRTGQLIVETRAVPHHDVYSFTAYGREYIDHEWFFQLLQYFAYASLGLAGVTALKCILIFATFAFIARHCVARGVTAVETAGLIFLAIAGAIPRLLERPELYSTLLAVLTYLVLDDYGRRGNVRTLILLPVISVVWSNIHAAVVIGLILQMLFILSVAWERRRGMIVPLGVTLLASIIAVGANPFGYRVLSVPFELTSIIESGVLTNREWTPPRFRSAPLFWIVLPAVAVSLGTRVRRIRAFTILVTLFFGYLALRYVRNVGLFCTFAPLLMIDDRRRWRLAFAACGVPALLLATTITYPFERGIGVASSMPAKLAAVVKRDDLRGHILNADWFGGYLIWALYPERRVFIDGRNEVYEPLLKRLSVAEVDSREWTALLRDCAIEYAVLPYVDRLNMVTTIAPDGSRTTAYSSWSVLRFPRRDWALIDFDDSGMIFVRRAGPNGHLATREYRSVFPEGTGYQRGLIDSGAVRRADVIGELQRKIAEDPACSRARDLLRSATK